MTCIDLYFPSKKNSLKSLETSLILRKQNQENFSLWNTSRKSILLSYPHWFSLTQNQRFRLVSKKGEWRKIIRRGNPYLKKNKQKVCNRADRCFEEWHKHSSFLMSITKRQETIKDFLTRTEFCKISLYRYGLIFSEIAQVWVVDNVKQLIAICKNLLFTKKLKYLNHLGKDFYGN